MAVLGIDPLAGPESVLNLTEFLPEPFIGLVARAAGRFPVLAHGFHAVADSP